MKAACPWREVGVNGVGDQAPMIHHQELTQSDLNGLQAECELVLRRSQSAAFRSDELHYINLLKAQLEHAHKLVKDARP